METYYYDRNAHQRQQLAALLIMLLGHPDLSPRELVDLLNGTCRYHMSEPNTPHPFATHQLPSLPLLPLWLHHVSQSV